MLTDKIPSTSTVVRELMRLEEQRVARQAAQTNAFPMSSKDQQPKR